MRHVIIGLPLAIALIGAVFYWRPYWIPSGSMKPTLLVGDYVVATPLWGAPERGDVLAYRHPTNDAIFIARLIGLPGDRVLMVDGGLTLNDQPVDLQSDGSFIEVMEPQGPVGGWPACANDPVGIGGDCEKQQQIETLPNDISYAILNIGDRATDNTGVFTVPEGQYFMLGDNRDNSVDSRIDRLRGGVGFVPAENVRRRVARILFSSAGRSLADVSNWRSDRYFRPVR